MKEDYKKLIDEVCREPDDLKRKLRFLALLTEDLKQDGISPILVGGTALEFYTFGGYATADIDIVVSGREKVAKVLEEMGFEREGRHWYNEGIDVAVEIPDNTLAGSNDKAVSVSIDGKKAYIIGPEDLIVDRLSAAKFWKVQSDLDWAVSLLLLHSDKIDREYLAGAAEKAGVDDMLSRVLKEYETLAKNKTHTLEPRLRSQERRPRR